MTDTRLYGEFRAPCRNRPAPGRTANDGMSADRMATHHKPLHQAFWAWNLTN